ncbi:YhcN/YlaJ family sporulation lipoprotein [Pseudalkalibacillus berkeleyi]|uniref:YhcN/YlaJ family sporulation lipoprotein n=1 Tax=Pseudalkalibacillus berkeleyi TaxID=1069813 RepID=A0ABS9H3N2_9BACL|nr:YhcN/YlaJ family sporulation lipoprotein [Pseudalkalibacillus berkeleyi]MCF6138546.1 YhcN/YlaJ family sporulation lipoprotein [Pseudalkalibacillus berkeleyi]
MKKFIIAGLTCSLLILPACGMDKGDYDGANGNGLNRTMDARDRAGTPGKTPEDAINDFGYTRIQSPSDERGPMSKIPQLDRKQLSNIISRMVMQFRDVKDSATLVTSDKVLIVYEAKTDDRNKTADMVKKTALSVVPRWFKVYVSDDTTLFEDIERYKNLDETTAHVKNSVDGLVKEMKKSPQGERMSGYEGEEGKMDTDMGIRNQSGKMK